MKLISIIMALLTVLSPLAPGLAWRHLAGLSHARRRAWGGMPPGRLPAGGGGGGAAIAPGSSEVRGASDKCGAPTMCACMLFERVPPLASAGFWMCGTPASTG